MVLSDRRWYCCPRSRVKRVLDGPGTDMTGARRMCYIASDSASQVPDDAGLVVLVHLNSHQAARGAVLTMC